MAIMLDNQRLYQQTTRLATTPVALLLIAAMIVWEIGFENGSNVHIFFALLTAALPCGARWPAMAFFPIEQSGGGVHR
jgi:hypothetical protein